jgi:hypothetical protein
VTTSALKSTFWLLGTTDGGAGDAAGAAGDASCAAAGAANARISGSAVQPNFPTFNV